MASTANATTERLTNDVDNGDIVATESVADDILIHDATDAELGDLIGPWEAPVHLTNEADYDFDYLAQTIYAGPGEDGVFRPQTGVEKPGQGITLDNGIKKPGGGIVLDNQVNTPNKRQLQQLDGNQPRKKRRRKKR